jgi:hypothetical protein
MWTNHCDRDLRQSREDASYYHSQYEDLQRRQEQEADARERDRKERQRERQRDREEAYRQTDDWREALLRQASLMARELRALPPIDESDTFFTRSREACERAVSIYDEEAALLAGELAELDKRRIAICEQIRRNTGLRLREEQPENDNENGWLSVANELIEGDMTPSEWLNW